MTYTLCEENRGRRGQAREIGFQGWDNFWECYPSRQPSAGSFRGLVMDIPPSTSIAFALPRRHAFAPTDCVFYSTLTVIPLDRTTRMGLCRWASP